MKKTGKERKIVKFVPERGWVANKHIAKIILQKIAHWRKKIYKAKSAKKEK